MGIFSDFSGSILLVLRDGAPSLPKMLWPWSRGLGFVTATCHIHAACAYSPFALGRSPAPLVGQALLLAGGVHCRWAYTLGAELRSRLASIFKGQGPGLVHSSVDCTGGRARGGGDIFASGELSWAGARNGNYTAVISVSLSLCSSIAQYHFQLIKPRTCKTANLSSDRK